MTREKGYAYNRRFCASGAGRNNNEQFSKSQQWFGQDKQHSTLNHNFNKIFSIGSGCGQTEFFFPA
jgi:hypothetical protein